LPSQFRRATSGHADISLQKTASFKKADNGIFTLGVDDAAFTVRQYRFSGPDLG
jgi:hypothetical protein